jgi:hypothetical protein
VCTLPLSQLQHFITNSLEFLVNLYQYVRPDGCNDQIPLDVSVVTARGLLAHCVRSDVPVDTYFFGRYLSPIISSPDYLKFILFKRLVSRDYLVDYIRRTVNYFRKRYTDRIGKCKIQYNTKQKFIQKCIQNVF